MCECGEDGIKVKNGKLYAFDNLWYEIINAKFCPFCGEYLMKKEKNDSGK
jgi:hypothetical protein